MGLPPPQILGDRPPVLSKSLPMVKGKLKVRKRKTCFGNCPFSVAGPCYCPEQHSNIHTMCIHGENPDLKHTISRRHISDMSHGFLSRGPCNDMCCVRAP